MLDFLSKLFSDNINIYFILFLIISYIFISKIVIDKEKMQFKMIIIYIFLYIVIICSVINIKEIIIFTIFITFIFLEFITNDNFFVKNAKKPSYYILDYVYKMLFEYKILYFFISIILISKTFENLSRHIYVYLNLNKIFYFTKWNTTDIYTSITIFLSLLFLIIGLIKIMNEEFETLNISEIKEKMEGIKPFENFSSNKKLYNFSKMLIFKEDKSFFEREDSYNWMSIPFVIYRLKRTYNYCQDYRLSNIKYIGKLMHIVICFIYIILKCIVLISKISFKILKASINIILRKHSISDYFRGYSTIEMQLVRTLAVQHGYSSNVYKRKIYEMVYSQIYFASLKNYYCYHKYSNVDEYRYYLIYLYIRIAPVNINGKEFKTILEMYNKLEINEIEVEEFYVWTLGLSHRWVDINLLDSETVKIFKMKKKYLKELINKYEE